MFRFYAASWAHRSLPNFVLYQTSLCFDVLCSRVVKRTYETLLHIKIGLRSKVCHLLAKTSGGAYACMGQERGSWSVLHIVLFSGRFWVKPYPYKAKKGWKICPLSGHHLSVRSSSICSPRMACQFLWSGMLGLGAVDSDSWEIKELHSALFYMQGEGGWSFCKPPARSGVKGVPNQTPTLDPDLHQNFILFGAEKELLEIDLPLEFSPAHLGTHSTNWVCRA
jgi:hypothetical protein